MASMSMPMAKVLIFSPLSLAAMEHTSEESRPPESRKPTLASATSLFLTPSVSLSFMPRQISSRSPPTSSSAAVISR